MDHEQVAKRVLNYQQRIEELADGRDVTLVAVTKGFGVEAIQAALASGVHDVGENYAQEAKKKHDELTEVASLRWHFIGHLQSNKVKLLAPFVSVWQSVDSISLINEIAKHAPSASVFIEVNLSGEAGRSGCDWLDVAALVITAREKGLNVRGLMGVGALGDPELSRPLFRRLRQEALSLDLSELSMGMSGDFEIAIEEGSTLVRIGSGIFGERPMKVSK